ncbi:MAG TPA: sigma-70 family RNA polymerase sigma factor [Gaiellaceae bacterium]|jgi:RNA polymerase sigma-70 factor (ECF subfamily)|nr:sigma-70 family RNA polymerase sigma factor [Gaiellaceae bacterium]
MAKTEIDEVLIARARRGDDGAFTALIRRHDDELRALAYRLLGNRTQMDDALQEAYVKAYRALPRFRGDAAFGTWLYRIVYNACLDALKRTRDVVPLDSVRERPDPRPGAGERIPTRSALADALAELEPADRAAVLLVDAQGFDYRSAGEVLGVPEGTVASRLNRARSHLRGALAPHLEGASNR